MVNDVLNFITYNFRNSAWIAVFIVSMLPIAEAKVAIPFGMAKGVWGKLALSPWVSGLVAYIGSTLPAIFIILFLKPVFNVLKKSKIFKNFVLRLELLFKKKSEREISVVYLKEQKQLRQQERKLREILKTPTKNGNNVVKKREKIINILSEKELIYNKNKEISKLKQFVTLIFFVALPLPLAGVWMSSAIASMSNMRFWPAFLAIAFGNLIEVIFITIVCALFTDSIGYVLIASVLLIIAYTVAMHLINKRRHKIIETAMAKVVGGNHK